jgi:hypothetical protein
VQFRIWSNEHNSWWRADSRGYTTDVEQAGMYSLAEAFGVGMSSSLGSSPGAPKEELVDQDGLRFAVEFLRKESV